MKRFNQLLFVPVLLVLSGVARADTAAQSQVASSEKSKPNMVFILADDMNRDTWGVYGSKDCKTPHIDKLASEGVRFDRVYCAVAMCAPFRQELYSGRTPWRTGTLPNHSKSKPDTKSIAHYLKRLGYRVALLGKTHCGPRQAYPFEYLKIKADKKSDGNLELLKETQKFIQSCQAEGKPFCLFIASNDGHAPFTTGDPSRYDAKQLTIPPYWLDTPELRETLVKYYAEITNFDVLVGAVREELEQRDLWKQTLFMVCSEQGTQLPFAKWTCYDNGLRSGLVAHWDGRIQPGSRIDELISIADITPTLVEAAGGKLKPSDCDGRSFLGMLDGKKMVVNDYVYGAFTNCNIIHNRDRVYPIRVIRDKSYSLIYNPNHTKMTANLTLMNALSVLQGSQPKFEDIGTSWVELARDNPELKPTIKKLHHRSEFELYDLDRDPYELKNEATNPKYADVLERLKKQLFKRLKELGDSDPVKTEQGLVKGKAKNRAK